MATSGAKILVVDDDADVRAITAAAFEAEGCHVRQVGCAMEAFDELEARRPDLVVLDVVMPGVSGLDVLDYIRERDQDLPVILLTSLTADENVVRGLRRGAEDYVVKPCSPRVLVARAVRALQRAGRPIASSVVTCGDLSIDTDSREVRLGGTLVELTAREFDLLAFFVSNPGKVYDRRRLLVEVWESSHEWQQEATVTEHIRRLRRKLETDPATPVWIATVRGAGYRFDRRASSRSASAKTA